MDRRTRPYLFPTQNFAEIEFLCSQQIHMIERCYEHHSCRKSFDQRLQLVRHLRIKPQQKILEPSIHKSHCLWNYCFFAVSFSSFTYLHIVTISFNSVKHHGFVRRHSRNSDSIAFVWKVLCSNVPEAKHAFSLEETYSDCMLTLLYEFFSRLAVQSLA